MSVLFIMVENIVYDVHIRYTVSEKYPFPADNTRKFIVRVLAGPFDSLKKSVSPAIHVATLTISDLNFETPYRLPWHTHGHSLSTLLLIFSFLIRVVYECI